MRELRPCRKCGRKPVFIPYGESMDGNSDKPAKVVCPCGNRHILTWKEFFHAMDGVPPEKRGRGYMSRAEIEAAGDAAADAWNVEQGDAPATDDERRRVAVELRELSWCAVTSDSTYEVLASVLHVGRSDFSDEVFARLADLIEPGEQKVRCVAEVKIDGERLEELVHDAAVELTGIDRDALLALADDLDYAGANVENVAYIDQTFHEAARRIREALGEAS